MQQTLAHVYYVHCRILLVLLRTYGIRNRHRNIDFLQKLSIAET